MAWQESDKQAFWSNVGRSSFSKIMELEDDLRVVGNNMKQLEISEQEVKWRVGEKEWATNPLQPLRIFNIEVKLLIAYRPPD